MVIRHSALWLLKRQLVSQLGNRLPVWLHNQFLRKTRVVALALSVSFVSSLPPLVVSANAAPRNETQKQAQSQAQKQAPSQADTTNESATVGVTYPITEKHFLEAMAAKMRKKEMDGEFAQFQKEAIARNTKLIESPRPVDGITRTATPRSTYFDPSVAVERDVRLPDGTLLAAAGSRFNPLDRVAMSTPLLFIDGRDDQQISMAKRYWNQQNGQVKVVLVAGSYMDLMRSWKHQVYFDQAGKLTQRFAISHVPAMVYQEGKMLRIDEMVVTP